MQSIVAIDALTVCAPTRLGGDARVSFRNVALECLERAGQMGAGALTIDLRCTDELDATGLGLLVMLHKRARERGVTTILAHVPPHLRMLLAATKLDSLFQFEQ
ncbi:MAG TPA: STAS domain-containing protein [Gemmatimonadaceae bacterium]|nr:STAS domain-containing protein [Gemmatimonadaceae bacterium]